jgi:hypothetical protein
MSEQKNPQSEDQKGSNELSDQDLEKVSGGTPPKTTTTIGVSATDPSASGSGVQVNLPHP